MSSSRNVPGARLLAGLLPRRTPDMAVLFIDPDSASAQPLAQALRRVSAVALVPTWQMAKAAIATRAPNLIVTELDLPDANGVDLIASVHTSPALRHVLVVVVTARATIQDKIAAFQAGADDYLVKPVAPQEFVEHVQRLSHFRQILSDSS